MALDWQPATIVHRHDWSEGLFTLRLDATADFKAGQFVNLTCSPGGDRHTRRAYSIASAPGAPLEFFIVEVLDGNVSPMLCSLQPGDTLYTTTRGKGMFTLDALPEARDLWMVSTGTGLAPYLSMMREGPIFERFERLILVYGARYGHQLAYGPELDALVEARNGQLIVQRLTSREEVDGAMPGRVTARLRDGGLEQAVGIEVDPRHSHVQLCGNPAMIQEMNDLLAERGLTRHTRREPGHVSYEKYW